MAGTATAEWITLPVAASMLGCGVKAVRRLVESGRLTSRAVPNSYVRVLKSEVEDLADACTTSRAS